MVAWTRAVVRHRRKIIAAWLVLFVLGGAAASQLGKLLSNRFSVPGSDAERGLNLAKSKMGERGDGDFTVVFQARQGTVASPRFKAAAERAAQQAAHAIKGGKAGLLLPAGPTVAYTQIATPLQ